MTKLDTRDLTLSTASDRASQQYNAGVELLLSAWPGAAEHLDAAIDADPGFALAHAARARLHGVSAEPAKARLRIAEAERLAQAHGDARERSHVGVLSLAANGQPQAALARALAHLDLWPRDALILSLPLGAFGLFAFSGMADHDQARVDLCARHESAYPADDWWFLSSAGWALAENGEVARGRASLERALDLRRRNAHGVHGLVHALFEAGAGEEAERLIAAWMPDYGRDGVLHGHLAWHMALLALERGEAGRALALYTEYVQPSRSLGMPINIVSDGASLLWRLDAYGHGAPKALWTQLRDYSSEAFPAAGQAFVDTHMLMIAAATGDQAALETRLTALAEQAGRWLRGGGFVVPTIGRALRAFAEGDFAGCAALLEPVAQDVVRIGGSGAQREVIEDTLIIALMRSDARAKARDLLDRRLHRRPSPRDARWRQSFAACGPSA